MPQTQTKTTQTKTKPDEEAPHEHHGIWEQLAHYAHYAHLSAEGAEVVAHAARHVSAAQKLVRTHAQMAYDLARMHRNIATLKYLAGIGGDVGHTAAWRLIRARGLYGSTRLAFDAERQAAVAARILLSEARTAQGGLRGAAAFRIGQAAVRLETVLKGSQIGSKLLTAGRIVASKPFINGLVVFGGAMAAANAYVESPAVTTPGKLANAALGGGAGALTMVNPVVAGADLVCRRASSRVLCSAEQRTR